MSLPLPSAPWTPMDRAAALAELAQLASKNDELRSSAAKVSHQISEKRKRAADLLLSAEREEESITNKLLRRVDQMKNENKKMQTRIVAEDEDLHRLEAQIAQMRAAREEIQNRVEFEQESTMNRLQSQLLDMAHEKRRIELQLHGERHAFLQRLRQRVGSLHFSDPSPRSTADISSSPADQDLVAGGHHQDPTESIAPASTSPRPQKATEEEVLRLEREIESLLHEHEKVSDAAKSKASVCNEVADQLKILRRDAALAREKARRVKINLEKALADLDYEKQRSMQISTPTQSVDSSIASSSRAPCETIEQRLSAARSSSGAATVGETPTGLPMDQPHVPTAIIELRSRTERMLGSSHSVASQPHTGGA